MLDFYKFIFTNIWTYIGTIGLILAIGEVIVASIKQASYGRRYNVLGEMLEDVLYEEDENEEYTQ